MARTFTYSETRQNLASVLFQAEKDGEVIITKKDGKRFVLRKISSERSSLDVPGIDVGMTRQDILTTIREERMKEVRERRDSQQPE